MTRLSMEKILQTAQQYEVDIEMTPSATPFVIQTSTEHVHLAAADMVQIICGYSVSEIVALEDANDIVWNADFTVRHPVAKQVHNTCDSYTISDLPAVG